MDLGRLDIQILCVILECNDLSNIFGQRKRTLSDMETVDSGTKIHRSKLAIWLLDLISMRTGVRMKMLMDKKVLVMTIAIMGLSSLPGNACTEHEAARSKFIRNEIIRS